MIWLKLFEERFNYVSLLINIWIDFIYVILTYLHYLLTKILYIIIFADYNQIHILSILEQAKIWYIIIEDYKFFLSRINQRHKKCAKKFYM